MRWLTVVLALIVGACSPGAERPTDEPESVSTPGPTPTATLEPTKRPWPAKFETNVCLAMTQFTLAGEDSETLSEAATDLDVLEVVSLAESIEGTLLTAKAALRKAGRWKPAATFLKRIKKGTDTIIRAVRDIKNGASAFDAGLLERGSERMVTGTKQINRATAALVTLQAKTGFSCD